MITSPSRKTSPSSISSSRSTQRSRVDLPEPEAPISATASCSATARSMPRRTSRSPKDFVTPRSSRTGGAVTSHAGPCAGAPAVAVDDPGERHRDQQVEQRRRDQRRVVEGRAAASICADPERLQRAEDRDQGDVLLQGDEVVQQRRRHPAHRLRQDHVAHRLRLGQADRERRVALARGGPSRCPAR